MLRKDRSITKKMITMQMLEKGRMGRPEKRWLDNIRQDMTDYNMTDELAENRSMWHRKIKVGPLLQGRGL